MANIRKPRLKRGEHIEIHWKDHFFVNDTLTLEEVKDRISKPIIRKTRGYYIMQDKHTICIASTIEDDNSYTECNFLLKKDIIYRSDKDETSCSR